ncbi:amidophosphoribosyltransferase [Alkaliflexus imshenetskii]|uniref:amidophosphoribosyltransferase n=1 Tax=Alkaliflexus imshenetskii TaxID=286730 RepID=UPI000479F012|nr:amidophosphoribosyltransferase [Alkaliflexus imshenetskii]
MSGFFGSVSKNDCVMDVFYGTDYHSHLGTKRAGMAFYSKEKAFQRAIHSLEDGYFRNKFDNDIKGFRGNIGLGVISDHEAQPILVSSHLGRFAVVTVCRITNINELEQRFINERRTFAETSQGSVNPTELVAMLIAECDDFVSGINNVFANIKGSCTMLIMTDDRIIAARDSYGRTPIVIGMKEGAYALTFETSAFPNLSYEPIHYLGAGEIVEVDVDGFRQLQKPGDKMQACAFLWVYYGYPPSIYENINVDESRYNCGAVLAKHETVKADFVAAIPDSGIGHAMGFSGETGIPLKRPYSKYTPTWPRSFMPQNQETRDLVAKMKLIPNKAVLEGKSGIFLDDSIVRGTQLRDNVKDLHAGGIKEIHMRIACPPIIFPCPFLNFSSSRSSLDLATRKAIKHLEGDENANLDQYADPKSEKYAAMVEYIRQDLGLTTLKFQNLDDLVTAIGLPKEKLCTHCWDNSSSL